MRADFPSGQHFRHSAEACNVKFEHTHWRGKGDSKIVSLLRIQMRHEFSTSEIDILRVSPASLREISDALASAANDLDAHHRQVQIEEMTS